MNTLQVDVADAGQRLDVYLTDKLPQRSRSQWQKLIVSGQARLNGQPTSPSQTLHQDDIVTITTKPKSNIEIELPILFEDENIIVINKPHGLLTHPVSKHDNNQSVTGILGQKLPINNTSNNNRPGVVHRLDRATSGVMVLAKTSEIQTQLQQLFANREVMKEYRAVVEGEFEHETAIITLPIGRDMSNPSQFRVDPNGKSAETEVIRLAINDERSYLKLLPKTGRTHQLRVHLKHIGHPIVGDPLYGKANGRLLLHAHRLSFKLNKHDCSFEAPLPVEFNYE